MIKKKEPVLAGITELVANYKHYSLEEETKHYNIDSGDEKQDEKEVILCMRCAQDDDESFIFNCFDCKSSLCIECEKNGSCRFCHNGEPCFNRHECRTPAAQSSRSSLQAASHPKAPIQEESAQQEEELPQPKRHKSMLDTRKVSCKRRSQSTWQHFLNMDLLTMKAHMKVSRPERN